MLSVAGHGACVSGVTMTSDLTRDRGLAQELLRLYKLAVAEQRSDVADHLLCALEQLSKREPACVPILDQAYLWGTSGGGGLQGR
jgi:hypothetical protein